MTGRRLLSVAQSIGRSRFVPLCVCCLRLAIPCIFGGATTVHAFIMTLIAHRSGLSDTRAHWGGPRARFGTKYGRSSDRKLNRSWQVGPPRGTKISLFPSREMGDARTSIGLMARELSMTPHRSMDLGG